MRTPEDIEKILDKVEDFFKKYEEADDKFQRDGWAKKFEAKLGPYCEKLKIINGDDFDLMKESFDEYHNEYSDLTDDEYVDALEGNIKELLGKLKGALDEGDTAEAAHVAEEIKEQAEETAEQLDETAHDEVKEDAAGETTTEEATANETAEADNAEAEEIVEDNLEEKGSDDELEEFNKAVEEAKERYGE